MFRTIAAQNIATSSVVEKIVIRRFGEKNLEKLQRPGTIQKGISTLSDS